jgi:hypothetical protein
VAYYRFYFLDTNDRIRRAIDVQCSDDNHAIEQAKERLEGRALEVWQASRPVRRVNADGTTALMSARPMPIGQAPQTAS